MTDHALNPYGDKMIPTTGKHGGDISSQRMDDLDQEAILFALGRAPSSLIALDVGCGRGFQGLRFASLGIRTLLIDVLSSDRTVMQARGIESVLPITYLKKNVRLIIDSDIQNEIGLCYSQRFVHYLRFGEALRLLRFLRARMASDGRLFLSASGLWSELGVGYAAYREPVATRYSKMSHAMAAKHNIHEPVCLYTMDDLITLCDHSLFRPERVFSSSFGNVKGIFAPC